MRRGPLIFSGAFHLVVFILAITGLPFLARHEFIIPPPMVVDLIDVSKITQTNKLSPKPVQPPEKPEKPEEKRPPPTPKNTASEAVVPVAKEPPKPEEKKEPKKDKAVTVDPDAPPDKNKKDKKPKEKKEVPPKEPPKDFSSVLKNLADPKDRPSAQELLDQKLKEIAAPEAAQNAPLGERMTMSEQDALRSQLERCWNVPFGAKDAEDMIVDIFMVINPDRTLREARIVDTARYNSDSFFRAAADSALRAVRSDLCSPFELPPDKYNTWNTITVSFNPKDMF